MESAQSKNRCLLHIKLVMGWALLVVPNLFNTELRWSQYRLPLSSQIFPKEVYIEHGKQGYVYKQPTYTMLGWEQQRDVCWELWILHCGHTSWLQAALLDKSLRASQECMSCCHFTRPLCSALAASAKTHPSWLGGRDPSGSLWRGSWKSSLEILPVSGTGGTLALSLAEKGEDWFLT